MRYEEFSTVGEVTHSRTFEGTPEEILKLVKGLNENFNTPKDKRINLAPNLDIDKVIRSLAERLEKELPKSL